MQFPHTVRLIAISAAACTVAACSSFGIYKPTAGMVLPTSSVEIEVKWLPAQTPGQFAISVDGTPVLASAITMGASSATATIKNLAPGPHKVEASGNVYDPLYRQTSTRSGVVNFTVATPPGPSFTMNATPALLTVQRGQSTNLTVTVVRSNGLTGPVTLSATSSAFGTAAVVGQVTGTASTATLALAVPAAAPFGETGVRVEAVAQGNNGPINRTDNINLRVLRAQGNFSQANFAVTTPPARATSQSGLTVEAVTGASAANPAAYVAVFRNAAGQNAGFPIGYNHGDPAGPTSAFGGAGFCAAGNSGFVIAGAGPGVNPGSQYTVTFRDLTSQNADKSVPVNESRTGLGIPPYSYIPTVHFNPDCSVAIVVGVHSTGPTNNTAQIVDVARNVSVGAVEFDSSAFVAKIETNGNEQRVAFVADGRTQYRSIGP